MEQPVTFEKPRPPKLGLALSGGGFRATIFHLGVLRRLAELDLLRQVGVISTVSGGSVTGAHYLLHLKHRIEKEGVLKPEHYREIIDAMEWEFRQGVAKNPRSRLFLNFSWNLKIFCFADPPGERMASLYQQLFFHRITRWLRQSEGPEARVRRPLRLGEMLVKDKEILDLESHNRARGESVPASRRQIERVPKLVMNGSSLNSGRAFRFTAVEVGDDRLGYVRTDETSLVQDCKQLLASARAATNVDNALDEFSKRVSGEGQESDITGRRAVVAQRSTLTWFIRVDGTIRREERRPETALQALPPHDSWDRMQRLAEYFDAINPGASENTREEDRYIDSKDVRAARLELSRKLVRAPFGYLRRAKISAWYLFDNKWNEIPQRGGFDKEGHSRRFWQSLVLIDKGLVECLGVSSTALNNTSPLPAEASEADVARRRAEWAPEVPEDLQQFILCLYYLRSARAFAWDVDRGFKSIRLVDAVASSANFPPVFTPFHVHQLYDPATVRYLSLTDGGVHDNTGVQALMEEECTDIIISDVSGVLPHAKSPAGDRVNMMARIGSILTDGLWQMQRDRALDRAKLSTLAEANRVSPTRFDDYVLWKTIFFDMRSKPSDAKPGDEIKPHPYARLIAGIRTDLDVFGTIEIDALLYQGYQLADRFVREYLRPEIKDVKKSAPLTRWEPDDSEHAGKVLGASALRIGRLMTIYRTFFSVLLFTIGTGLLILLVKYPVSLHDMWWAARHTIWDAITGFEKCVWELLLPKCAENWIPNARGVFFEWVRNDPGPCGLIVVALGLFMIFSARVDDAFGRFWVRTFGERTQLQQARLRIARWLSPWRRNLLWFLWLLPLWIALFGSIVCGALMMSGLLTRHFTSIKAKRRRNSI